MGKLERPLSLPELELKRFAQLARRLLSGRPGFAPGGNLVSRRVGQGSEFLDYRQYQPGDDMRSIDWRASVRSREIRVRRFAAEASADWFICLDGSSSMLVAGESGWRLSMQLCMAFAYLLLDLGHRVGVVVFNSSVEAFSELGRGRTQYLRLLSLLNSVQPVSRGVATNPAACLPYLGMSKSVVLISDCLVPDNMRGFLEQLVHQQDQVHALRVTTQRQFDLPGTAALVLEDVESGARRLVGDPAKAAGQARSAAEESARQLRDWCARNRIQFTPAMADESWQKILLGHLRQGNHRGA